MTDYFPLLINTKINWAYETFFSKSKTKNAGANQAFLYREEYFLEIYHCL